MRILIVKLSSFGDVVAALPAVTDAVAAGAEVDWLVDTAFAHVAALHPGVSRIHAFDGRGTRWRPLAWPGAWADRGALKRTLKARAYDVVVDIQGLLKSASPARWAGAPVHGYDPQSIREPLASKLYEVRHTVPWTLHAVERNRALTAAAMGRPAPTAVGRFGLDRARDGAAADYGVILHSASWASKLWAEARWRALLERYASADLPFKLPWGSAEERERAERLAAGLPHVSVLDERLTQDALARFLGSARLVVGLDSGLMHLANALGAPTVWLFGSTSPDKTGPYGDGAQVIRSTNPHAPCLTRTCRHEGGACMEGISAEAVSAAVDVALGRIGAAR